MSQPPEWSGQDPQQPPHAEQPGYGQAPPPTGGPPPDAFAGFWIRFLGALIDGILLGVAGSILSGILPGMDVGIFGGNSLLSIALGAAYFGYLHSSKAGQTVGQLAVGIRVVNVAGGGEVTVQNALLRWAMSYVSALPIALGYLWMLWDPAKQTWHDKVGSTYVVKTSHYPPPASFGQR